MSEKQQISSICWWVTQSYCICKRILILTIAQANDFLKIYISSWQFECIKTKYFLDPSIHLSASQLHTHPSISRRIGHKCFLFTLIGNVISHRNYQTCTYNPYRNMSIPRHCNVLFTENDCSLMKLNRVIIYSDFIHSFIVSKYCCSKFERTKLFLRDSIGFSIVLIWFKFEVN